MTRGVAIRVVTRGATTKTDPCTAVMCTPPLGTKRPLFASLSAVSEGACVWCRQEDLRALFEKFGDVKDVYVPKDFHTGQPREFAYIQYAASSLSICCVPYAALHVVLDRFVDGRDAADAVRGLREGPTLNGRTLQVSFARTERKTPEEMLREEAQGKSKRRYVPPHPLPFTHITALHCTSLRVMHYAWLCAPPNHPSPKAPSKDEREQKRKKVCPLPHAHALGKHTAPTALPCTALHCTPARAKASERKERKRKKKRVTHKAKRSEAKQRQQQNKAKKAKPKKG